MSLDAASTETRIAGAASRGRVARIFAWWVAFWDRREPATSLAYARILVGAALFGDMLLGRYQGAMPTLLVPPPFGTGSGESALPSFLPAPSTGSDGIGLLWWLVLVVASSMFSLGAFYRVAGVALTVAIVNFARFDPDGDAIDMLLRVVVPVLTLSRANACCSVDAWRARKSGKTMPALVPAWPRHLLVLQVLWMYFSAAHCRDDVAWWPQGGFAAIGNVIGDPHFARFAPGSLVSLYPLCQVATAVSMMFEMSAPLFLLLTWFRTEGGGAFGAFARQWRIRWIWLATGAALHLGIALTMTLGMFPFGVLALYPLFLHPDEHARVRAAFRRFAFALRGAPNA